MTDNREKVEKSYQPSSDRGDRASYQPRTPQETGERKPPPSDDD